MTTPEFFYGTGRRKCSVARVFLVPNGTGKFNINNKVVDKYFLRKNNIITASSGLKLLEDASLDLNITVSGGGMSGQSGAIKMGLGRAILQYKPELHGALREGQFLTRDSRMVERKKPGCIKARKKQQFNKR